MNGIFHISVVVHKIGKGTYNFSDYLPTILHVIVLYNDQLTYIISFRWSINLNLWGSLDIYRCGGPLVRKGPNTQA